MLDYIYILDMAGTFAFAISGVLTAVEKKFDLVGAALVGAITAIGGGTIRDVLIGSTPVGWMQDLNYIYVVVAAMLLCYLLYGSVVRLRKSLFLFDAIGLGIFTILGIEKSLAVGLSPLIALLMGVISGVFGGVLRDVLTNEVPLIFRKEIYAIACFTGGLVYLIGTNWIESPWVILFLSMMTVIAIRILAVRYKWHTPFNPQSWKR